MLGCGAALPEVSNLGGHFQRCRFGFSFGSCHGQGYSVFNLYFKQIYVIARTNWLARNFLNYDNAKKAYDRSHAVFIRYL